MANIKWLANGQPYSEQFQDIYFSTEDGFAESEYVFLRQNRLPERFTQALEQPFNILETGFGSGLNFLISCLHFLTSAAPTAQLNYISVEKYPLSPSQLKQAYECFTRCWPQLAPICQELLAHYPETLSDDKIVQPIHLFANRVHLQLIIDDATRGLQHFINTQPAVKQSIDACYLDGFAPARNPDMWREALFQSIAQYCHTGTTLATFTAAGKVRRGLNAAGFTMSKAAGFGKKREILYGLFSAQKHSGTTSSCLTLEQRQQTSSLS